MITNGRPTGFKRVPSTTPTKILDVHELLYMGIAICNVIEQAEEIGQPLDQIVHEIGVAALDDLSKLIKDRQKELR